MKFFRKPSVAILLTFLLVALCCVFGYSRAYESSQSNRNENEQTLLAGENSLNYFLNWIDDRADLFSIETADTLARNNLELNNTYGCLLAIKTEHYLNGQNIETYAKNLFERFQLGSQDFLLVIEASSQNWYLVYGSGLREYADNNAALSDLIRKNLNDAFFHGQSDASILALFDDLENWCSQTLPKQDASNEIGNPFLQNYNTIRAVTLGDIFKGILFSLLVNIWWIVLLIVILNLVDRHRFYKYITAYPPVAGVVPPVFFRPLLFWHRHGSTWYYRMIQLIAEATYDSDDGEDDFENSNHKQGPGGPNADGSGYNPGPNADPQGDPNFTGPGPDIGPHAAGFSEGFQGRPDELFRQKSPCLWQLWRSTCQRGWNMIQRFWPGRRL